MKTVLAAETGRLRGHHVTQNILAVMRKLRACVVEGADQNRRHRPKDVIDERLDVNPVDL